MHSLWIKFLLLLVSIQALMPATVRASDWIPIINGSIVVFVPNPLELKADTFTVEEDQVNPIPYLDVFANDLRISDTNTQLMVSRITAGQNITKGNVQVATDPADGKTKVLYTPPTNFFGTDYFEYSVVDSVSGEHEPVLVTVNVTSVNDAPDFEPRHGTGPIRFYFTVDASEYNNAVFELPIFYDELDVEDNASQLEFSWFETGAHNGTYGYFTTSNNKGSSKHGHIYFNLGSITTSNTGTAYALFRVKDSEGLETERNRAVYVHLTTTQQTVNAVNDDIWAVKGQTVEYDVTANDELKGANIRITAQPQSGNVTVLPNGKISYQPNSSNVASDTFRYQIYSNDYISNTARVAIGFRSDDTVTIKHFRYFPPTVAVGETAWFNWNIEGVAGCYQIEDGRERIRGASGSINYGVQSTAGTFTQKWYCTDNDGYRYPFNRSEFLEATLVVTEPEPTPEPDPNKKIISIDIELLGRPVAEAETNGGTL